MHEQLELGLESMVKHPTGATKSDSAGKLDIEGFINPAVLAMYCEYMHRKRQTALGLRDSDNWQLGIEDDVLMKSLLRHVLDLWLHHRKEAGAVEDYADSLSAIFFNVQALMLNHTRR